MKIAVVGLGYVGLANSMLLSKNHEVVAMDTNHKKISMLNDGIATIKDSDIQDYLDYHIKNNSLNNKIHKDRGSFRATNNISDACENAEFIILATPTNYDEEKNYFDTSSIESSIDDILKINLTATFVIKSTIPLGYTEKLKKKFNIKRIIFSPEFLREGRALHDNLYPSRIIIGDVSNSAKKFASIMLEGVINKDTKVIHTGSHEAEAIKLFSNSYLAMRVAYFNELDTYAQINNLDTKAIIEGVSADTRIGNNYNNPSFGFGGYCLPKDTKQLKANFKSIPNSIINSIVNSNEIRKDFIAKFIIEQHPKCVGVYRLIMKSGSDNYRESAIIDVISRLTKKNMKVLIYEPILDEEGMNNFKNVEFTNDLGTLKRNSDLIIANRVTDEISDVENKIYTRDLYSKD